MRDSIEKMLNEYLTKHHPARILFNGLQEIGDMYLIGPNSSGTYDEYYWLDTKNKWEFLGNTGVDMSEYITEAEADKKYATLDKVEQLEEDNDLVYMLD